MTLFGFKASPAVNTLFWALRFICDNCRRRIYQFMNARKSPLHRLTFRIVGVALLLAVGVILLNSETRGPFLDLIGQVGASFGKLATALQSVLNSPPAG